jgi:hypothetical protein
MTAATATAPNGQAGAEGTPPFGGRGKLLGDRS